MIYTCHQTLSHEIKNNEIGGGRGHVIGTEEMHR
jgi:hypothetical protein